MTNEATPGALASTEGLGLTVGRAYPATGAVPAVPTPHTDVKIGISTMRVYTQAELDAAVAAERERCALLAVEAAAEAVKKYENDPTPVRQPYANNRLMHVGWAAADAIRGPNDRSNRAAEGGPVD